MSTPPRDLLDEVCWSFAEPVARSAADFVEAACAYAVEIDVDDPRDLLLQHLPFADVRVRYDHAVRESDGQWRDQTSEVRIVGTRLERLRGADLLWELHVACAAKVGDNDHHFFEGFRLEDAGGPHGPPTYRAFLGS